jgi:hypothetical protein
MQHDSTSIVSNDDAVAVRHSETDFDVGLGQIRETTGVGFVLLKHAALYNHAVNNYQYLAGEGTKKMRYMRGGRSFVRPMICIVLSVVSFALMNIMVYVNKAIGAIPIVISITDESLRVKSPDWLNSQSCKI